MEKGFDPKVLRESVEQESINIKDYEKFLNTTLDVETIRLYSVKISKAEDRIARYKKIIDILESNDNSA